MTNTQIIAALKVLPEGTETSVTIDDAQVNIRMSLTDWEQTFAGSGLTATEYTYSWHIESGGVHYWGRKPQAATTPAAKRVL